MWTINDELNDDILEYISKAGGTFKLVSKRSNKSVTYAYYPSKKGMGYSLYKQEENDERLFIGFVFNNKDGTSTEMLSHTVASKFELDDPIFRVSYWLIRNWNNREVLRAGCALYAS